MDAIKGQGVQVRWKRECVQKFNFPTQKNWSAAHTALPSKDALHYNLKSTSGQAATRNVPHAALSACTVWTLVCRLESGQRETSVKVAAKHKARPGFDQKSESNTPPLLKNTKN